VRRRQSSFNTQNIPILGDVAEPVQCFVTPAGSWHTPAISAGRSCSDCAAVFHAVCRLSTMSDDKTLPELKLDPGQ